MANLIEDLTRIGFSPKVEADFREKLSDHYEQFLALVAREVSITSEKAANLRHTSKDGKQFLMDHMGKGIIDAVADHPEKWLEIPVTV